MGTEKSYSDDHRSREMKDAVLINLENLVLQWYMLN